MSATLQSKSSIDPPFDSVASIYDSELDASPVIPNLRRVMWEVVGQNVPSGGSILELNCGTGTDAIELAKRGYSVTATDIAHKMLEQGMLKASALSLPYAIRWQQLDVAAVTPDTFAANSFDAVFSDFGGLNCLDPRQLSTGLNNLADSLKPGGVLILSIMGKYCLWEFLAFALRGNFGGARRRTRNRALIAKLGATEFNVWYFTPGQLEEMVATWASCADLLGLSIFSPPPDSRTFINAFPGLTNVLLKADSVVRRWFPFRHLGDHFIFVARKRP